MPFFILQQANGSCSFKTQPVSPPALTLQSSFRRCAGSPGATALLIWSHSATGASCDWCRPGTWCAYLCHYGADNEWILWVFSGLVLLARLLKVIHWLRHIADNLLCFSGFCSWSDCWTSKAAFFFFFCLWGFLGEPAGWICWDLLLQNIYTWPVFVMH